MTMTAISDKSRTCRECWSQDIIGAAVSSWWFLRLTEVCEAQVPQSDSPEQINTGNASGAAWASSESGAAGSVLLPVGFVFPFFLLFQTKSSFHVASLLRHKKISPSEESRGVFLWENAPQGCLSYRGFSMRWCAPSWWAKLIQAAQALLLAWN